MGYTFDFTFVSSYIPEFINGIQLTIWMTLCTIVPGFLIGAGCAMARMHGPSWLRAIAVGYVEGIRNTPLVIQVFWLFFGLAVLGARIGPVPAAIIALIINTGAYSAEILRAGLQSVPKGEVEAAGCLALSRWQIFWYVELPQAAEKVYPALISQFVLMMLATSIMSQISVEELTGVGYQIQATTFRGFEVYLVIAVVYLVLATSLRFLMYGAAMLAFPRLRRLGTPL